jgi:hypothetical protein
MGTQVHGFCRMCIPKALMNGSYYVTVDGASPDYANYSVCENGACRWIWFSYHHSTVEIVIVQESPITMIVPLCTVLTALAVASTKKKPSGRLA